MTAGDGSLEYCSSSLMSLLDAMVIAHRSSLLLEHVDDSGKTRACSSTVTCQLLSRGTAPTLDWTLDRVTLAHVSLPIDLVK